MSRGGKTSVLLYISSSIWIGLYTKTFFGCKAPL